MFVYSGDARNDVRRAFPRGHTSSGIERTGNTLRLPANSCSRNDRSAANGIAIDDIVAPASTRSTRTDDACDRVISRSIDIRVFCVEILFTLIRFESEPGLERADFNPRSHRFSSCSTPRPERIVRGGSVRKRRRDRYREGERERE